MTDPKIMCRQHLLGEHVELHMFVGTIRKGVSMQGYVDNNLLELSSIEARHDELVAEMERRGMNHHSPLPAFQSRNFGKVDREAAKADLLSRCEKCRALYNQAKEQE